MIKHYLKLTIKLLKRKRVFTFVTLAGIVCPVLLIVLTASFLTHIDDYSPPRSNFKDVIYLDEITWQEIRENGEINMNMTSPPSYYFIKTYIKKMETPAKVAAVSMPSLKNTVYLQGNPYEASIKHTDNVFWEIADFEFVYGRYYNINEYSNGNNVIVIDEKTSLAFFGKVNSVGKNIDIENKNYKVIGVVENVDITYFRLSANIYIPFTCSDEFNASSIYAGYSSAFILIDNPEDYIKADNEFRKILEQVSFHNNEPINHVEGSLTKETYLSRVGLLLMNFFEIYDFNRNIFYLVVGLLVFLFIILPAVNLVNININRIYERLPEIGVKRSYGASKKKLIEQFLFENLFITFLGGLISLILAAIIIYFINYFDVLTGVYLKLNYKAFIISIFAIFALGFLSGIFPSLSMARKNITVSLNT